MTPIVEGRGLTRSFPDARGPGDGAARRVAPRRARATTSRSPGRRAAASRRCCTCSAASTRRARDRWSSKGATSARSAKSERSRIRLTRIGFVFQRFFLLPMLTAWENVELPQAEAGAAKAERRARTRELLDYVGLADRARSPAVAAVGRRDAARGDRARAGEPAGAAAGRRADRRARRGDRRADRGALRSRPRRRHRDRRRHAQSGAGRARGPAPGDEERTRGHAHDPAARAAIAGDAAGADGGARVRLRLRHRRDGGAARRRRRDPRAGALARARGRRRRRRRRDGSAPSRTRGSCSRACSERRTSRRRSVARVAVEEGDAVSDEGRPCDRGVGHRRRCRAASGRSATARSRGAPAWADAPGDARVGVARSRRRAARDGSLSPDSRRAGVRGVVGRVALLQRPHGRWPRCGSISRSWSGPRRAAGRRAAGVRLQLDRDGKTTTYSARRGGGRGGGARRRAGPRHRRQPRAARRARTYRIALALPGAAGDADARCRAGPVAAAGDDPRRARLGHGLHRAGAVGHGVAAT